MLFIFFFWVYVFINATIFVMMISRFVLHKFHCNLLMSNYLKIKVNLSIFICFISNAKKTIGIKMVSKKKSFIFIIIWDENTLTSKSVRKLSLTRTMSMKKWLARYQCHRITWNLCMLLFFWLFYFFDGLPQQLYSLP